MLSVKAHFKDKYKNTKLLERQRNIYLPLELCSLMRNILVLMSETESISAGIFTSKIGCRACALYFLPLLGHADKKTVHSMMLTQHPSQQDTIPITVSVNQGWVFLLPLYYLIIMCSFCVCVYLSDGLWDPVAAAGVCEANGCVHADLVANRHINRLRTPVRASQCLNTKTDVFISAHFPL